MTPAITSTSFGTPGGAAAAPRVARPTAPATHRRPVIVWDLDDTLNDLASTLCARLATVDGSPADIAGWHDYATCQQVFAGSYAGFIDAMICGQVLEASLPVPAARDVLATYSAEGFQQIIVTSRAWHPAAAGITEAWLTRHQIRQYVDAVYIVAADKTPTINAIGPVTLYAEDAAHHVAAALARCQISRVAIPDRPWNASYTPPSRQVRRIATLADLLQI